MKSVFTKAIFHDIRFWIIIFGIIRLYGITNPPLEVAHSWRQVTVNMVARNFFEHDSNIFYPQVDMAGEKTGITGMEFPLLNYLIYLMFKIFSFQHWYGRLINLIVSSIGIFYFYKIVQYYFSKQLAFNASLILLSSIWFAYSRKIMPDTFSVSLVIMGLYFTAQYLSNGKLFQLLISFIFLCLGVLSKLPAGYLLPLILLMIFPFKNHQTKRLTGIGIILILILVINSIWYFYWVPHLVKTFGYWHFYMGTSLFQGISEISQNLMLTAEKFYSDALKFSGFILFIVGIFLAFKHKNRQILWVLLLGIGAFSLVVFKGGRTFYLHSYYIIPFVPIMALVAAHTFQYIKNKRFIPLLLVIIMAEGLLNQMHDFHIKTQDSHVLNLENITNITVPQNKLIVINGDVNPRDLYFTHRKGWTLANYQLEQHTLDSLKSLGCSFLIVDKTKELPLPKNNFPISFQNSDFLIYALQ